MVILSTLLYCNVIPSEWCREGANFLLAEMMLFFVPTVVAIIKYIPLLIDFGWKIFLVIAVSSLTVFGTTAWVVDKMYKFEVTKRSEIK
jgi:holin-like protein